MTGAESVDITRELARGKFTDEMLNDMRARIGLELRTDACVNNEDATRLAILRFCEGIGDDNPLWTDPDYGGMTPHGMLIAPPSFIFACLASVQFGWRGLGGFHAETKLTFHRTTDGLPTPPPSTSPRPGTTKLRGSTPRRFIIDTATMAKG